MILGGDYCNFAVSFVCAYKC